MRISLCEIIEMPGKSLPFSCTLETERLMQPAIEEFSSPPHAEGVITNTAGALTLSGVITAEFTCYCDRCGRQTQRSFELPLSVKLAADLEDDDNPEIFPIYGNELDLGDVLETCYILNAESKFLCGKDCMGLCPRCGKDLNEGPCSCDKEIDPRLAVLQQLLDKKDE